MLLRHNCIVWITKEQQRFGKKHTIFFTKTKAIMVEGIEKITIKILIK